MALKRGDIVLVPFPFSDLSSRKVRPAIVVSPDPQAEDMLLASISSSQQFLKLTSTDLLLEAIHPDFSKTGLKRTSVFKMSKLLTLHRSIILRQLGKVSKDLQNEIDKRLVKAVGLVK